MAKPQVSTNLRKIPSQERSRQTFALLVEAAAQVLESQGEEAVTTNAVAERAGYSIGTLYQYFPDQDAILVALAEREKSRILERMRSLMGKIDGGDSEGRLRDFVRALIQSFAKRRGARRQFSLMVARTAKRERDGRGVDLDEFSDILIEAWRKLRLEREAAMDRIHAFVLTRALLGVLRAAALEDTPLIKEQAFEDALIALIVSFRAAYLGADPS
jgi:AcrR family transcriptional regulator